MSKARSQSQPRSVATLDMHDHAALSDLVRFGALTSEQLERRFAPLAHRTITTRLNRLKAAGLLQQHFRVLPDQTRIHIPTSLTARAVGLHLSGSPTTERLLKHTLTCVSVADWLLENHRGAHFRTEKELMGRHEPMARRGHDTSHRPDGLLILPGGRRIAIEVELNAKTHAEYGKISRWFASRSDIDEVRWYVRQHYLLHTIPQVLEAYWLTEDIGVHVLLLPEWLQVWP